MEYCSKEIDLKNWKGNKKNSGFLPEERAWLDDLFADDKFIDALEVLIKMKKNIPGGPTGECKRRTLVGE